MPDLGWVIGKELRSVCAGGDRRRKLAKGLGEFPTGVRSRAKRVVAQARFFTSDSRP